MVLLYVLQAAQEKHPEHAQQLERCPDPTHDGRPYKPRMTQVPFVAICANGHLDDFPFDLWVHRSKRPSCNGVLRLAFLAEEAASTARS